MKDFTYYLRQAVEAELNVEFLSARIVDNKNAFDYPGDHDRKVFIMTAVQSGSDRLTSIVDLTPEEINKVIFATTSDKMELYPVLIARIVLDIMDMVSDNEYNVGMRIN